MGALLGATHVIGTWAPEQSVCAAGTDFDIDVSRPGRTHRGYPATKLTVDSRGACFGQWARGIYSVQGMTAGQTAISLEIVQVGPQAFVTHCDDIFPIDTGNPHRRRRFRRSQPLTRPRSADTARLGSRIHQRVVRSALGMGVSAPVASSQDS